MHLILDANVCAGAMKSGKDCEYPTFVKCLLIGKGKLSIGGTTQMDEYNRINEMKRFVATLDRAGKIARVSTVEVDERAEDLGRGGALSSDDPHIIALAQIGKARLLCTKDKALISDFTNPKLIFSPRGKVYSGERNNKLLARAMPKAK